MKNHLAALNPECVIGNALLKIRNWNKKPVVVIVATAAEFLLAGTKFSAVTHLAGNGININIMVQKVLKGLQPSFNERLESSIDISRADFRALTMSWPSVCKCQETKDGYW